jgi:cytochrome c oxidase assembly protein subunit 15
MTGTMAHPLRWLAALASTGMLLVLVMGAAVTNTGSAQGCGRSWPLCNGQFVPEFTVATAIEYSHRAVTGVEGVLIVALTLAMLALWRHEREVQVLAPLMLGSLLLQAGLGAAAVMLPQSPAVLASHFGISLVAFASTFLSSVWVFERTGRAPAERPAAVPPGFRWAVLGVGLYVLVVVYLGAFVRHTGVSLACSDWPLCNGQLVPSLEGGTGIVFAHRLAALGVVALLGWLSVWANRLGIAPGTALTAFALSLLQAASGAVVVVTQLGLFSTLSHAAIMALLFGGLALLTRRVLIDAVRDALDPAVRDLSAPVAWLDPSVQRPVRAVPERAPAGVAAS